MAQIEIFDITIDNFREATQADVDRLTKIACCYHELRLIAEYGSPRNGTPVDWDKELQGLRALRQQKEATHV